MENNLTMYSVMHKGVEMKASKEDMITFINENEMPVRFSESENSFVSIDGMNINWLANSIVLALVATEGDKVATKRILTSVEFKNFVKRYDDYLAL